MAGVESQEKKPVWGRAGMPQGRGKDVNAMQLKYRNGGACGSNIIVLFGVCGEGVSTATEIK